MNAKIERPAIVKGEHLIYLDDLQKSNDTNMFGAGPYLERNFGLRKYDARTIVTYWMDSFEERFPEGRLDES